MAKLQVLFQLTAAEHAPVTERYPVPTRQIGGGEHTFDFQQLVKTLRPSGKREHRFVIVIQIQHGEHLASDRLVADPEHQVRAPLHGFDDVG